MSKERGFTIVELVVVVSIMAILLTIGSLNFSEMQRKSKVEEQVRSIYSTLTDVRLQAMYTKTPRAVTVVGSTLCIYATDDTTAAPSSVVTLAFPMVIGPGGGSRSLRRVGGGEFSRTRHLRGAWKRGGKSRQHRQHHHLGGAHLHRKKKIRRRLCPKQH